MLLALTGYETGLLVVALCFIVFALVAALVIPRSRPEFPGNRLGLFLAICGVFFVAQMTAVLVLAEVGEADEPAHEEPAAPGEETEPTETAETEPETDAEPTAKPAGDAGAGQGGLPRHRRVRELPHARRRRRDRSDRPEPRRGEPPPTSWSSSA